MRYVLASLGPIQFSRELSLSGSWPRHAAPTCLVQAAEDHIDIRPRWLRHLSDKKGIALNSESNFIEREKSRLRVELRRMRSTVHERRHRIAKMDLRDAFLNYFRDQLSGLTIAAYWPLKDEIDVRPILSALAQRGLVTALPVMKDNASPQSFRRWLPGDALVDAAFGVQEPHPRRIHLVPDLIIVPLLGFDIFGNRIGYGGGYYDRTLHSLRTSGKIVAIGVGYDEQECDKIPVHAFDEPVDMIFTDKRVLFPRTEHKESVF